MLTTEVLLADAATVIRELQALIDSKTAWKPELHEPWQQRALELIGDPQCQQRDQLRGLVATMSVGLVVDVATRFQGRGVTTEELIQVGTIGLLKAIDRFDVTRGTAFASFAYPTIMGEIRRYFRDHTWSVHTPRPLQELYYKIGRLQSAHLSATGDYLTALELAQRLGREIEEVHAALQAGAGHTAGSLDAPTGDGGDLTAGSRIVDVYAADHDELHFDWLALSPVFGRLPERERRILALRFVDDKTQTEIAAITGISQMHISRLLAATIAALRCWLLEEDPARLDQRARRLYSLMVS